MVRTPIRYGNIGFRVGFKFHAESKLAKISSVASFWLRDTLKPRVNLCCTFGPELLSALWERKARFWWGGPRGCRGQC